MSIVLDEYQERSVAACLNVKQRCAATTGPAGSGKTTIITNVYQQLRAAGYTPVVAAPTGKAAKRVREATGLPASTFHKLLEFTSPTDIDERTGKPYGDTIPRRRADRPLDYDTVIGDEYAMVNRELHRDIVTALPKGGRLLTFGDRQQLDPIEKEEKYQNEPSAFTTLLEKFNGVVLERVHRHSEGSGILDNAQKVLKGLAPKATTDFAMSITERPVDRIREVLLAGTDYTALNNQIITPSNKSWIGTAKLNDVVQRDTMPLDTEWFMLPRHKWDTHPVRVGVGDKVVMNKNWYDIEAYDGSTGVFNGEVGRVMEITSDDAVVVDFEDRIVSIPAAMETMIRGRQTVVYPQRDLSLAYVLTTHKCQGSEYKRVIYVMNKSVSIMLNRRNFYTGITRAREHVTLVTDAAALGRALRVREQVRW